MTATLEQQAPGCFGAASVYSMDSVVCQACPAFPKCGDVAIANLEQIRGLVDVSDLLNRHAAARQSAQIRQRQVTIPIVASPIPVAQPKTIDKPVERKTTKARVSFDISPDDQHVIAILGEKSVKAREQAIVLCKTNKLNLMRAKLPKGENPFAESGPKYLSIACSMLINGGFTRASLKAQMIEQLDWTDGTAGSHVAITCGLMLAFKIASYCDGAFTLNPDLGRDNNESNKHEGKE